MDLRCECTLNEILHEFGTHTDGTSILIGTKIFLSDHLCPYPLTETALQSALARALTDSEKQALKDRLTAEAERRDKVCPRRQ